jgi:prepilin-type N-terminal cleavage/methylation domain-containing protein
MKLPFTIYDLRSAIWGKSSESAAGNRQSPVINHQFRRAFTMVEIAICLAIIGIALVGIIGALPLGMRMQRDNREQTVINQDATIFMEAIRSGTRGMDDLTNYVFMITNTYAGDLNYPRAYSNFTGGAEIIGLLSTPEFVDGNHVSATPANFVYSNRMVALVYSMSGPAVEKPPQLNGSLIRQSSFSYGLMCENLPVGTYTPPPWQSSQAYNAGVSVTYILNGQTTYWQAIVAFDSVDNKTLPPQSGNAPGTSTRWARNYYPQQLAANLHELRLTFSWPLLPNSQPPLVHYGTGHQTYRALIAGRQVLDTNTVPNLNLYFFQSQSFTNAP